MIARTQRFHGRGSLKYAYRQGRTVRSVYFSLRYLPNSRRRSYRAAVIVSRKVSKSAVVRNRIRRRLYESLRAYQPALDATPHDLILTVFSHEPATMPAVELQAQLKNLLAQAGLIDRPML